MLQLSAVRKPRKATELVPMGKVAYNSTAKEANTLDQSHIVQELI